MSWITDFLLVALVGLFIASILTLIAMVVTIACLMFRAERQVQKATLSPGPLFNHAPQASPIPWIPASLPNQDDVITCYRGYQVLTSWDAFQTIAILRGSMGVFWRTNTLHAEHRCGYSVEHQQKQPPMTNCDCGIYAMSNRDSVDWSMPVVAQCVIWGRVQIAEDGYRAEWCRIEKLWLKPDLLSLAGPFSANQLAQFLQGHYQVPVEIEPSSYPASAQDKSFSISMLPTIPTVTGSTFRAGA